MSNKNRVGRPPNEEPKYKATTRLTQKQIDFLIAIGGNKSKGIEECVNRLMTICEQCTLMPSQNA